MTRTLYRSNAYSRYCYTRRRGTRLCKRYRWNPFIYWLQRIKTCHQLHCSAASCACDPFNASKLIANSTVEKKGIHATGILFISFICRRGLLNSSVWENIRKKNISFQKACTRYRVEQSSNVCNISQVSQVNHARNKETKLYNYIDNNNNNNNVIINTNIPNNTVLNNKSIVINQTSNINNSCSLDRINGHIFVRCTLNTHTFLRKSSPSVLISTNTHEALVIFGGCAAVGGSRWLLNDVREIPLNGLIDKSFHPKKKQITATGIPQHDSNCVHSLHNMYWKRCLTSTSTRFPQRRHLHSFTTISPSQIILFGGSSAVECFDDMWVWDMSNSTWNQVVQKKENNKIMPHPGARKRHRALIWDRPISTLWDDTMIPSHMSTGNAIASNYKDMHINFSNNYLKQLTLVIYGGITQRGTHLHDLWFFNLASLTWKEALFSRFIYPRFPTIRRPTACLGLWRDTIILCGNLYHDHNIHPIIVENIEQCSQINKLKEHNNLNEKITVYGYDYSRDTLWCVPNTHEHAPVWETRTQINSVIIGANFYFFSASYRSPTLSHIFNCITRSWSVSYIEWTPTAAIWKGTAQLFFSPNYYHIIGIGDDSDIIRFESKTFYRSWKWEQRHLCVWLRSLALKNEWKQKCITTNEFDWVNFFQFISNDVFRCILEYL